jgi:hypothetical protein
MDDDSAVGTETPTTTASLGQPARRVRAFTAAAAAGGLVFSVYAYSAFRWAPLDSATILALVFGLLLLAYAALAAIGVRAAVIAPFVVAALLLPWVCGAAALAGLGQRVGGAIEDFSNDLSGSSSLEQPVAPLVEESVQPTPEESNLVAPSEEEVFPSPPADAAPAAAPGAPVVFEQELGGGDVSKWRVTVTDVQCGLTSLKKAEYKDDGTVGTATPRSGHEFCLVETKWTNVGKTEAGGGANLLGSLMVAGKAIEHQDKDINRGFAVMDQRNLDAQPVLKAGKSAPQIAVYEVPDGTVPDAVWISRDQPKVLAALK